jgi:AcrR family transcriptional regulator
VAELDLQRIAAAALELIDRGGPGAFTMRAVADSLGVAPMSLYHYVADKEALARIVVEASLAEHPFPEPTGGTWRDDIVVLAHWVLDAYRSHPGLPALQREYGIWTQAMASVLERWISLWHQSGLDHELALRAATTSCVAIVGAVNVLTAQSDVPKDDVDLTWMPNTRAAQKRERDADDDFDLLVHAVIDGLLARLSDASGVGA